jgi:hypothetical protein
MNASARIGAWIGRTDAALRGVAIVEETLVNHGNFECICGKL